MRARGASEIWELFVPDLEDAALYKFEIKGEDGTIRLKTDPFAFRMEFRPGPLASCTRSPTRSGRTRSGCVKERRPTSPRPRFHLRGSSRILATHNGTLGYRDLAHQLVDYAKEMGFTHLELMPIAEHPLDQSYGYQVLGYYAPTSRFGTPDDFQYFVNHCHLNGIGVLLDWVLARSDRTTLYEHYDPRQRAHPDWGTLDFKYGQKEVCNVLIANTLLWLDRHH